MKKGILSHPDKAWMGIGLVIMLVTAWFSVGYHHPDEHYQLLEFYNYRMGLSPLSDLPWEYATHCRSALQPFLVYCFSAVLGALGISSTVTLAFVLRLCMAIFTWYTTCRLIIVLAPTLANRRVQQLYAAMALFAWFVPYVGVRFSAEAIASNCFFLALAMLLEQQQDKQGKPLRLVAIGLLLGFTLFFRLQMGLAYIGLVIWVLFIRKMKVIEWGTIAACALAAMGLSVVVDHWFYGIWTFTPYNYFDINIVKNVAAKFGVMPWWHYFKQFAEVGFMPVSIPLMLMYMAGVGRKPLHLLALVSATFFIGHFAIGHKELRFLFPMISAFIYMAAASIDKAADASFPKWQLIVFRVLAGVNICVLVFKMFTPASEVVKYYEFIYNYSRQQPTTIVGIGSSPYKLDVIECNFYKPRNMDIVVVKDTAELRQTLDHIGATRTVIYLSRTLNPDSMMKPFAAERLYCEYPEWLLNFNFNNWQERSYIWAVYRLKTH